MEPSRHKNRLIAPFGVLFYSLSPGKETACKIFSFFSLSSIRADLDIFYTIV